MEYVGVHTVCDTDKGDGNVYFEKEYMEFRTRHYQETNKEFRIYFKDIVNIKGYKGIKSTVVIDTADGKSTRFYMYKMNTFIELVESGRKGYNVVDAEFKTKEPLTDEQLDKLTKLNELHKEGVLSDSQFEEEKNLILNR